MPRRSLNTQLEQHRAALATCRRCSLNSCARPILSFASNPRIMLVGQAPGKTEISNSRPFAGRAGQTLFRWLARAGLEEADVRRQIYIAAVTRCYPGPSPSGRGDRVPSRTEQAACADWLTAELQMIRPRLIIPVGGLAIAQLLGPVPLDTVIGRVHTIHHVGGKSVAIPLPHPSGASSWIHLGNHPQLLETALELLRTEFARLHVGHITSRNSVNVTLG